MFLAVQRMTDESWMMAGIRWEQSINVFQLTANIYKLNCLLTMLCGNDHNDDDQK